MVERFPGGSDSKVSAYNVGDPDSIPGLGRSPGEGNGIAQHDAAGVVVGPFVRPVNREPRDGQRQCESAAQADT